MIGFDDPLLWAAFAFLAITTGMGVMLHSLLYGQKARLKRRIIFSIGAGAGADAELAGETQDRRRFISGKLKELDARRRKKGARSLARSITQAGLDLSPGRFLGISAIAAALAAAAGLVAGMPPFFALAVALICGLGLPRLLLGLLAKRRVGKFTTGFADAIDVIVRSVRSGLPVGEAFNIIVQEMQEPISGEFRLVVEGQRLGLTLEEALARACERVPTAELRFFSIVLAIQQSTGGNLADTLAKLSEVLRARKRMRDKVQAMSGEAKASAMIIGSLPPLVAALLAVVSPHYIAALFNTNIGHLILFAAASMMSVGVVVMRQMINFEI